MYQKIVAHISTCNEKNVTNFQHSVDTDESYELNHTTFPFASAKKIYNAYTKILITKWVCNGFCYFFRFLSTSIFLLFCFFFHVFVSFWVLILSFNWILFQKFFLFCFPLLLIMAHEHTTYNHFPPISFACFLHFHSLVASNVFFFFFAQLFFCAFNFFVFNSI